MGCLHWGLSWRVSLTSLRRHWAATGNLHPLVCVEQNQESEAHLRYQHKTKRNNCRRGLWMVVDGGGLLLYTYSSIFGIM